MDALSKNSLFSFSSSISSYNTDMENIINNSYINDEEYIKKWVNFEGKIKTEVLKILIKKSLLTYKNRLYVPNYEEVKHLILNGLHKKPYSRHLGYQKMITMLKKWLLLA